MKKIIAIFTLIFPAGLSAPTAAHAASPENLIVFDTLSTGKPQIAGRTPDKANAPGGKWIVFRDDWKEDAFAVSGIISIAQREKNLIYKDSTAQDAQKMIAAYPDLLLNIASHRNGNAVNAISIASNGGYKKPPRFTISADLGGFLQANAVLGFYSGAPATGGGNYIVAGKDYKNLFKDFTGLIFTTWNYPDVNLSKGATLTLPDRFDFVGKEPYNIEGAPNGTLTLFENGKSAASVKYTGTFDPTVPHRLSYDVDTATGAISNVKLQGSASDYSVFKSKAFTDAATAYAAVGVATAPDGATSQVPPHQHAIWVLVNNFRVGANLDPSLPMLKGNSTR